jgi:hypothetical protein
VKGKVAAMGSDLYGSREQCSKRGGTLFWYALAATGKRGQQGSLQGHPSLLDLPASSPQRTHPSNNNNKIPVSSLLDLVTFSFSLF